MPGLLKKKNKSGLPLPPFRTTLFRGGGREDGEAGWVDKQEPRALFLAFSSRAP